MGSSFNRAVALIPARGGSKGIPHKNLQLVGRRSLIERAIDVALATRGLDDVIVSTDSPEIREVAIAAGASVPFLRPAELATDVSPAIDTVRHLVENLEPKPTTVVLLQPTSPFRTSEQVESALEMFVQHGGRTLVSVCEAESHPAWTYELNEAGTLVPFIPNHTTRRQDLPPAYSVNGAIYIFTPKVVLDAGTIMSGDVVGFPMSRETSLDIDLPLDLKIAQLLAADNE